jgi:hypothetical protein
MLSGGSPLFSYLNNGCLVLCCDWGLQAERDVFVAAEITCRSSTAMMAVKKERRLPTANCIIIAPKRLKLRLSGSARKSQKRFRDTPRFKFQAGLARTQPFYHAAQRNGRPIPIQMQKNGQLLCNSQYVSLFSGLARLISNH